jgi:hypothetical protein
MMDKMSKSILSVHISHTLIPILDLLTFEDGIGMLSGNAGKELPLFAA